MYLYIDARHMISSNVFLLRILDSWNIKTCYVQGNIILQKAYIPLKLYSEAEGCTF